MSKVPEERVAVLVVDMQNAFCHRRGSFAAAGADISGCVSAIDGCVRLTATARAAGVPLIFTKAEHSPDYSDWPLLNELELFAPLRAAGSCVAGSWDAELVEQLRVEPGERVFSKSRYSAFIGTELDCHLEELGVENLVVGGVGTIACVESTVREASQRGFRTFVVRDAVGDIDADAHAASLRVQGSLFGWLTDCDEVAASWRVGPVAQGGGPPSRGG
jgi:ureidoacrylate peracid hydrolase